MITLEILFTVGCIVNSYNDKYIENNYPEIWKLLHGPGVHGAVESIYRFYKGYYDDGTDKKLNQIKYSETIYLKLLLWTWFVAVIDMIINQGARP